MNKSAASGVAAVSHPGGGTTVMPVVVPIDRGTHSYAYQNGLLATDTWTVDGVVYVKSYTYTNGLLTGESDWVRQ